MRHLPLRIDLCSCGVGLMSVSLCFAPGLWRMEEIRRHLMTDWWGARDRQGKKSRQAKRQPPQLWHRYSDLLNCIWRVFALNVSQWVSVTIILSAGTPHWHEWKRCVENFQPIRETVACSQSDLRLSEQRWEACLIDTHLHLQMFASFSFPGGI